MTSNERLTKILQEAIDANVGEPSPEAGAAADLLCLGVHSSLRVGITRDEVTRVVLLLLEASAVGLHPVVEGVIAPIA